MVNWFCEDEVRMQSVSSDDNSFLLPILENFSKSLSVG